MQNAELIHYLFMAIAIGFEVAANLFIKKSDGFRVRSAGAVGILCIWLSFTALANAVKGIDLSIAYAIWGGTGILLTATAGVVFFRQRLTRIGWTGLAFIAGGMSLFKLS